MARIILDLDGTLLDTSARHFAVYCSIASMAKTDVMPFNLYWKYRRDGLSNMDVLRLNGLAEEYHQVAISMWSNNIESVKMLKLDCIFADIIPWFEKYQDHVEFILVTLRTDIKALHAQLKWLGIYSYFKKIIAIPHHTRKYESAKAKASAIVDYLDSDIIGWIGDTGVDIQAAHQIGVRAIGVSGGMRTANRLQESGADEVIDSVTMFKFGL